MIKLIDLTYVTASNVEQREMINIASIDRLIVVKSERQSFMLELLMRNRDTIYLNFAKPKDRMLFIDEIYKIVKSSTASLIVKLDLVTPIVEDELETIAVDEIAEEPDVIAYIADDELDDEAVTVEVSVV